VAFDGQGPELSVISTGSPPPTSTTRTGATDVAVAQSGGVAAAAARKLGNVTASELSKDMTISAASSDADVVDIAATGTSAAEAASRADAYATALVHRERSRQKARARKIANDLTRRLNSLSYTEQHTGEGATLRDQIFQLETLAKYGTGSPRVIQRAGEATSRTDNPTQLIVLAVLFGLLLGGALALLRERSDRRLRDGEELADAIDVPVLASIGRSRAIRRGAGFDGLSESDAEAFRFLHGRLRFADGGSPVRTVLVTSASDGEGKTAVAANLAEAAAAGGSRVLLLEADTRRPDLAQRYGIASGYGLADVLRGDLDLDEAVEPRRIGDGPHALDVLPAGDAGGDAPALLQSDAMRELLAHLRSTYDLVVLDATPLGLTADALPLLARVDGVLIASFVGRSSAGDARRLRWQIEEMGGRVLGAVVSNGRAGAGYGYAPRPAEVASAG
jgi:capsular exopolysaccharide synthesis family protein